MQPVVRYHLVTLLDLPYCRLCPFPNIQFRILFQHLELCEETELFQLIGSLCTGLPIVRIVHPGEICDEPAKSKSYLNGWVIEFSE